MDKTVMANIPFVDLKKQYISIKDEIDKKISEILENTAFILGSDLREFESEFASFIGSKYCVGVSSGIDALIIALKSLGIREGDEVITAPNTFIATAEAISLAGARPVFADVNEQDFNIDVKKLEEKITDKTKAILPVHLFGQPADMAEIRNLSKKYDLFIVEDVCQAHGAEYNNKKAGTFGDIGCFSFYPGKNLGAYGDGGAVVTDNELLHKTMMLLRSHGEGEKNKHELIGSTNRLDNLQAAILRIKLKHLNAWNEKRIKNAFIYDKYLKNLDIKLPVVVKGRKHVFHLYVVRVKERDRIREGLNLNGISTGIHYPTPIHLQNAYKFLGYEAGDFPVAEEISKEIISLPIFPELSEEQISYVAEKLKKVL